MLSLQAVLNSNFKLWSRCEEVQLERNKQSFHILCEKCKDKGLDLSAVDVTHFMISTGSAMIAPSKLDAALAEYMGQAQSGESDADRDARVASIIDNIRVTRQTQLVAATRDRISRLRNACDEARNRHNESCAQLMRECIQLSDLTANTLPCTEGLKKFLAMPTVSVQGSNLVAITPEISLMHTVRDSEGTREVPVNFGKFKVSMSMEGSGLRVTPENPAIGLNCNGFFHPHVSSSTNPCLGNAAADVEEGFRVYDYSKIYESTLAILSVYNERSPYRQLSDFYAIQKRRETMGDMGDVTRWGSLERFENPEKANEVLSFLREHTNSRIEDAEISDRVYNMIGNGYFDHDFEYDSYNSRPSSDLDCYLLMLICMRYSGVFIIELMEYCFRSISFESVMGNADWHLAFQSIFNNADVCQMLRDDLLSGYNSDNAPDELERLLRVMNRIEIGNHSRSEYPTTDSYRIVEGRIEDLREAEREEYSDDSDDSDESQF